jgi:hypothetical protein
MRYPIKDFDDPILAIMAKLLGQNIDKGSGTMDAYLGIEWSYVIQEKFTENGKVVFKPVRYYLTPKQIFTRLKYDMRVIHSDIWVNAFFNTTKEEWMILPVQYPNQADGIISRGGIVIRVNDPANTSPISKEDSLMNHYTCTHTIEKKEGWANDMNKVLGLC